MATEDKPTIAGRALRALRTQPSEAPADAAPVDAAPADAAPEVDAPEAVAVDADTPAVDTPAVDAPETEEPTDDAVADAPTAETDVATEVEDDESAPAVATDADAADDAEPDRPKSRPGAALIASLVAVAVAAAVAIAGLVVFLVGERGRPTTQPSDYTEVMTAARIGINTLTTLDYRTAKRDLDRWLNVTGGSLHKNIAAGENDAVKTFEKAKRVTTGKVVASAVSSLDEDAKTPSATVIASVVVLGRDADGKSESSSRSRYQAQLEYTDGSWKILDLRLVTLELS